MLVNRTIKSERQKSTTRIQQPIKEVQQLQVPILLTNILNKTHELNFTIPAPSTKQAKPQYCQFATNLSCTNNSPNIFIQPAYNKTQDDHSNKPYTKHTMKTEARISDYMKTPNHIPVTEST